VQQHMKNEISKEWTVAGHWFKNLLHTAVSMGCDDDALLRKTGLTRRVIEYPNQHFHLADLLLLAHEIDWDRGTRDLGIHCILKNEPGAFGLLGMAAMTAPTLRAAWETVARYRILSLNTGDTYFFDRSDTVQMRWYPFARAINNYRFAVDVIMSGIIIHSGTLTGRDIRPEKVCLSYPKPALTPLFLRTYGRDVSFNQHYNSVSFRRQDMELELRSADPKMHALLCNQADTDMAQLKAKTSLSEKVENKIREHLNRGGANIEDIAARLNSSPRTLQRNLTREGTSFKELLNNVRHELATQYLMDSKQSTMDIALKLGYNHASSFCTAFKHWTGVPPSRYVSQ